MIDTIRELVKFKSYIDPGTGSLIIQVLIASVLGALYLIRDYVRRLINWIRREK